MESSTIRYTDATVAVAVAVATAATTATAVVAWNHESMKCTLCKRDFSIFHSITAPFVSTLSFVFVSSKNVKHVALAVRVFSCVWITKAKHFIHIWTRHKFSNKQSPVVRHIFLSPCCCSCYLDFFLLNLFHSFMRTTCFFLHLFSSVVAQKFVWKC